MTATTIKFNNSVSAWVKFSSCAQQAVMNDSILQITNIGCIPICTFPAFKHNPSNYNLYNILAQLVPCFSSYKNSKNHSFKINVSSAAEQYTESHLSYGPDVHAHMHMGMYACMCTHKLCSLLFHISNSSALNKDNFYDIVLTSVSVLLGIILIRKL